MAEETTNKVIATSTKEEVYNWLKKSVTEESAKKLIEEHRIDADFLLLLSQEDKTKIEGRLKGDYQLSATEAFKLATRISGLKAPTGDEEKKQLEETNKQLKRKMDKRDEFRRFLEHSDKVHLEMEALGLKDLVSPVLTKKGYSFVSFIYVTEESVVVKVLGPEGSRAVKLVMDDNAAQYEISLLSQLQHPHIIKLLDHFSLPDSCGKYKYALVFELQKSGVEFKPSSPNQLRDFMHQLLQAIAYCHSQGVVHSDIKPANILYKENNNSLVVSLADFDLACKNETNIRGGTAFYMAPEVRKSRKISFSADIWSAGLVFAELMGLKPSVSTMTSTNMKQLNNEVIASIKDPNLQNLMTKLLQVDPCQRPKAEELLQHIYFANV